MTEPSAPDGDSLKKIAQDYEGWAVFHDDTGWHASCPAVAVHADTPAELRSTIEHAIWGSTEHW